MALLERANGCPDDPQPKPRPKAKRKPRTWWLTVLDDGWAYDVNTSRRAAERNKPDWPCSLVRVREVLR